MIDIGKCNVNMRVGNKLTFMSLVCKLT